MTVYVVLHKPAPVPRDSVYVPLQVGTGEPFSPVRDNTGENIAGKNPSFCELTALYWIWKNAPGEILGLAHYRRYFSRRGRIATQAQLEAALADCDLLLPGKRHYVLETNYSHYAHAHHEKDLLLTRNVLMQLYPQDVPAFDRVMARRSGHRFNMLLARREILDAYCRWLFPLLFALEAQLDSSGYDAYNQRVFGFLGERLLDVWLEGRRLRVAELPVVNTQGEHWLQKGSRFLLRKLRGTLRKA